MTENQEMREMRADERQVADGICDSIAERRRLEFEEHDGISREVLDAIALQRGRR